MQLTIDADKNFIENLKQEFHTPNIKDALYQLLDFYKQSNAMDDEINQRVQDYKNGSLKTEDFHDGLEEIRKSIYSIDSVMKMYNSSSFSA